MAQGYSISRKSKRMIIVKVSGGLGNQLFQYALGRNIAISQNIEVAFDLIWYRIHKQRAYALEHFNANVRIASDKEAAPLRKYGPQKGRLAFIHNLFFLNPQRYILEEPFGSKMDILPSPDNTYLSGWWQSEKFFTNIASVIRNELTLKETPGEYFQKIATRARTTPSVGIHVRRGDYTTPKVQKGMKLLPASYYQSAVDKLAFSIKNPSFFIFSDDIEWAKKNISFPGETTFVSAEDKIRDYEELVLMSACKHQIIPNSSFGWWAAWLNQNQDKQVIAPLQWFSDHSKRADDIIPQGWQKI